nr:MAG TPA: DNA polymerase B Like Replicative Helicase [Caudoviricetes sp.]
MDIRVLLLQAIALLYWESLLDNEGINSKELVEEMIKTLPSPDQTSGTDDDRENMLFLRSLCVAMCSNPQAIPRSLLFSKIKHGIKNDEELRNDLTEFLGEEQQEKEALLDKCKSLRDEVKRYFTRRTFLDEMRRIASRTLYNRDHFEISAMAKEIIASVEPYVKGGGNSLEDDPALNGKGDLDDLEEMAKHFTIVQEDVSPESVLKTGWQAFNRMLGEVGGLRRGNAYVIGALPNKGKSYVTMRLTTDIMRINHPFMFEPTKKPMVVHFSMENDVPTNLKFLYRGLYEEEHQQPCDILNTDPHQMASYLKEKLLATGYHFKFYHLDPTNCDYRKILTQLLELEAEGYEIHLCAVDYLAMINSDGLKDESRAFWIRQLFKVMRNFTNPRKITLLTPHQVATDAAVLIRAGTDDFVKQIAGKRYWADCRSIDMEVDCEVVLNVEKDAQGNSWMAFGRGKDRSSPTTPEKDKFFFLPFAQYGGLIMDINGADTSKRSIRDTTIALDSDWKTDTEF